MQLDSSLPLFRCFRRRRRRLIYRISASPSSYSGHVAMSGVPLLVFLPFILAVLRQWGIIMLLNATGIIKFPELPTRRCGDSRVVALLSYIALIEERRPRPKL